MCFTCCGSSSVASDECTAGNRGLWAQPCVALHSFHLGDKVSSEVSRTGARTAAVVAGDLGPDLEPEFAGVRALEHGLDGHRRNAVSISGGAFFSK